MWELTNSLIAKWKVLLITLLKYPPQISHVLSENDQEWRLAMSDQRWRLAESDQEWRLAESDQERRLA
jgi:hypothetical protein